MKLFLPKNAKFSSAGGCAPKHPPPPPLRISGYAPEHAGVSYSLELSVWVRDHIKLQSFPHLIPSAKTKRILSLLYWLLPQAVWVNSL